MTAQRPSQFLNWNPSQSSVAQPPDSLRARGWQPGEAPLASAMNWALFTIDSWQQYFADSINNTLMTTTLDTSMRLLGGGTLSYVQSSGVFAWSQPLFLSIPSVADSDNQIAAGNVTVTAGQVIYVQANYPITSAGDLTSGSATVANVSYVQGIAAGQAVTGNGIASGTTVQSVSGNSVTLSLPATANGTQVAITYAGTGALTVQSANVASLVPNANTVILGRATNAGLYVGVNSGQVILRDGEQRRLLEAGYHDVRYLTVGSGFTVSARQAVYVSTATNNGITGSIYPTDASVANGLQRSVCIGFAATTTQSNNVCPVVTGGVLGGFSGLTVGSLYYLDPNNVGGITPTRPSSSNYVVPVGLALDAQNLYVRVSSASGAPVTDPTYNSVTAQTFSSGAGFKQIVGPMMFQASVNANGTIGGSQNPVYLQETNGAQIYTQKMPFAGSIVAVTINYRYSATQSTPPIISVLPTINGNQIGNSALNASYQAGQSGSADYAFDTSQSKGISKFVVNDGLGCALYTNAFSAPCTFYARVTLWIETQS